ncbi:MAG: hypothetical protein ABWZ25_16710 [Chitinophagaceae bacterium]
MLIMCGVTAHAQKKSSRKSKEADSLAIIREFVQVCNMYRELPLQLDLELHNSTNFITGIADTASTQAQFILEKNASYIHFGEIEQFVNDSVALLVSSHLQKMILYTDVRPMLSQLKAMAGWHLKDSSVEDISEKYKVLKRYSGNDTVTIELANRLSVYGGLPPRETIVLQYDPKTNVPFKIMTIKRTLITLTQEDYNKVSEQTGFSDKLLAPEGKGYFLVKEQQGTFLYKSVSHEQVKTRVTINERIIKNGQGEYLPARGYETYQVILN